MEIDFMDGRFPNPIPCPKGDWVDRLAKGSIIWLVKENQHAQVEWIWEPSPPNLSSGELGICRIARNWVGHCETWFVGITGCGIDGKPLITPCLGQLPDKPPLPKSEVRKMYRELARLKRRVDKLEAKGSILIEGECIDLKDANAEEPEVLALDVFKPILMHGFGLDRNPPLR